MRLLRKILLYDGSGTHPQNNRFRVRVAGANATAAVAASASGTEYYVSGDGSGSDLLAAIDTAVTNVGGQLTLDLVGVTIAADAARATGRVRAVNQDGAQNMIFYWSNVLTTLPIGVLGWSAVGDIAIGVSATDYSPSIHRYGWYPLQPPNLGGAGAETRHAWAEYEEIRGAVDEDGITWGGFAQRRLEWLEGVIPSPFLTAEAAADATWQAAYGLSTGTQYGHWEQFCEDIRDAETAGERDVRYYPDAITEATYYGPYRLRPVSLLADPMAAWSLPTPAGGCYAGVFDLRRAL